MSDRIEVRTGASFYAIQARALRNAADEIEANARAGALAKTRRRAISRRQRERDKATGHRLGAALSICDSLRRMADQLEGTK